MAVRRDNKVVAEEWERVKELFETALDCPPQQRAEFLSRLTQDDPAVASQVSDLLASHERAGDFLHLPLIFSADFLDDLEEPQRFAPDDVLCNRFKIVRLIGKGGMGEVYEAFDQELEERVALKTLRFEVSSNEIFTARFRREIQLARKVTHPNVCRIFESLRHQTGNETISVLSMELLQGQTLGDYLKSKGRLTADEALPLAKQIIDGLSAVHAAGIIHRDLKPSNLVLVPDGDALRVKITDFGIAGRLPENPSQPDLTQASKMLGTPDYMAPEQLEQGRATIQSDIYSLGLVLYEMVTGAKPFAEIGTWKRLYEDPCPPKKLAADLPECWNRTIVCCLERDPQYRFSSAEGVAESLNGDDTRTQIPKKPLVHRTAVALRKGVWLVLTFLLVSMALTILGMRYISKRAVIPGGAVLLLTDVQNETKDPYFMGITLALKSQLEQSAHFIVSGKEDARVMNALRVIRRKPEELPQQQVALEAALRNGFPLVIFGKLTRADQGYSLSLTVERAKYTPLFPVAKWTKSFEARNEKVLLDAVHLAAAWIRDIAGEPAADLASHNRPMQDITTNSWPALRLLQAANSMVAENDYKSAERLLRGALEEDAHFAMAQARLADILISSRRDRDGFIEWQKTFKSIRMHEANGQQELTDRESVRIKGQFYEDTGDYVTAETLFRQFAARYPQDYLAWFYWGSTLDKIGQRAEAINAFSRAADLQPDSSAVHAHLCMLYISLREFGKAQKEIAAVQSLGAADWEAWLRAILAFVQRDFNAAFKEVDRLGSSPSLSWQSQAYSIRASLLADLGKRQEALRTLEQGIAFDGNHGFRAERADKQIGQAYLHYRQKNFKSCRRMVRAATEVDDSPRHLLEAGTLLARIGDVAGARAQIHKLHRQTDNQITRIAIRRLEREIALAMDHAGTAADAFIDAQPGVSGGETIPATAGLVAHDATQQAAVISGQRADDPGHNLLYRDHDYPGLWADSISEVLHLQLTSGNLNCEQTALYLELRANDADRDIQLDEISELQRSYQLNCKN